jgi:hypothetical protein
VTRAGRHQAPPFRWDHSAPCGVQDLRDNPADLISGKTKRGTTNGTLQRHPGRGTSSRWLLATLCIVTCCLACAALCTDTSSGSSSTEVSTPPSGGIGQPGAGPGGFSGNMTRGGGGPGGPLENATMMQDLVQRLADQGYDMSTVQAAINGGDLDTARDLLREFKEAHRDELPGPQGAGTGGRPEDMPPPDSGFNGTPPGPS